MLINHALAQKYWPSGNAIGGRITFASQPKERDWLTVVGIVGDVKDTPNASSAMPAFYMALSQSPFQDLILALRTSAPLPEMAQFVRREIAALDKNLALAEVKPLEKIAVAAVAGQRLTLGLFASFAIAALVLAAIGIYGVLSYLVSQRTREIGIRLALGAMRSDVIWLALRRGMQPALIGVALGLAFAFALTRLMAGLVYGIGVTDLATFTACALILATVAFLACWFPARRAARVDATVALRNE